MFISNSESNIFTVNKTISVDGKSYILSFGNLREKERSVKINGSYTDVWIKEADIENMTPRFKEQVKTAIKQYDIALQQQQNYANWDGKLD